MEDNRKCKFVIEGHLNGLTDEEIAAVFEKFEEAAGEMFEANPLEGNPYAESAEFTTYKPDGSILDARMWVNPEVSGTDESVDNAS